MKFSRIHANRLRKLARHLRRGRLAHEKFNFRLVNADDHGRCVFDHCGTAGCALGEFHVVFPKFYGKKFWCGADDAEHFMALTYREAQNLFVPGSYPRLPGDSSPAEVAANIIVFLKTKGFDYND